MAHHLLQFLVGTPLTCSCDASVSVLPLLRLYRPACAVRKLSLSENHGQRVLGSTYMLLHFGGQVYTGVVPLEGIRELCGHRYPCAVRRRFHKCHCHTVWSDRAGGSYLDELVGRLQTLQHERHLAWLEAELSDLAHW